MVRTRVNRCLIRGTGPALGIGQGSHRYARAMTGVVVGSLGVVASVLVVSGVAKWINPAPTASLMGTLRLPSSRSSARLLGTVEVAAGAAALLIGGPILGAVVSVLYLAFAVVVVRARRAGAASCGCFGSSAAPPSWVHVWVNAASAAVAAATIVVGGTVVDLLRSQPANGVPFAILMTSGVVMVVGLDTAGAALFDQVAALHRGPSQ
jgi:hypothetical protein